MREVLISIQAEHNANIESGRKTEELRTRAPKCELPIKFYTYESGKNGRHKVTNEWICREIREYPNPDSYPLSLQERACVPFSYICDYAKDGEKLLHGLVITDLVVYDEPRELSEFATVDNEAVQNCNHRVQSYYDGFCNSGYLKCGFYCSVKDNWCDKCKTKPITRPPMSWQFCVATEPRQTAD